MISPSLLRLALLVASCFAINMAAAEQARVTGNISYRERMALPPGYLVKVRLLDISRQDAPSETLNSIELTPSHQVPVAYELSFDETRINPSHRYAVRAEIQVGGRLMFTSAQIYPVITQGAPRHADIWLQRVRSPKADAGTQSPKLAGEWLAEDISGRGVMDNLRSTLLFAENGRVNGMGGCNRFTGSYTSSGDRLEISPLAATMMACSPAVMDQEARFFAALKAVRSARIEGPFLLLFAGDGTQLVKFTRV